MSDTITSIKEMRSGLRVTINDSQLLYLTRRDCKSFPLQEGDTIDAEKLKHDLLLAQYPHALNRAVRLLAVRARSTHEIEKRLTDACYLPDTVEMVLTKLDTNGLLDDRAFAKQWARERTLRQIGKARILYELRQKGVDSQVAEEVIAALDADTMDSSARKLAEKLLRRYRGQTAADAARKTIQAMQRRGYSYGDARRALEEAAKDTDSSI